jgi:hypothetical protein
MKALRYLLLFLSSVLSGRATSEQIFPSEKQADLREITLLSIETEIADITHKSRDREMSQFRTYERKDIDGDRVDDAILLTTFEHGMNWHRELFVCLSSSPHRVMHLNLGGKGEQLAEEVEIKDQTIIIRGKKHADGDAMCCPSQPFKSTFIAADGKLLQRQ